MRRVFCLSVLLLALLSLVSTAQAAPKKQEKQRVLLQWTEADSMGQWIMTKHVGNLLDDLGQENVQLEVITYGPATFAVTTRPNTKFASDIEKFTKRGVVFHVCQHAMDLLGVKNDELLATVTPVKGAMWYINQKHQEGWQTLRP